MSWETGGLGFVAGLLIAAFTAPVGVSGAVFLLPVQLSVFGVPSPAVTPTNLLYNLVAVPGALVRYGREGRLGGPLVRLLVLGTLPGVVLGAVVRVLVLPDGDLFRLVAACVLLPIGSWLLWRTIRRAPVRGAPSGGLPSGGVPVGGATTGGGTTVTVPHGGPTPDRRDLQSGGVVVPMALVVGFVGGIYGIGGGSILGPLLVGRGLSVVVVAPAALTSTFVTSIVGSVTYAVLSLGHDGDVAPQWAIGLLCGIGGALGGYAGARMQRHLPEAALRAILGGTAVAIALVYVAQAIM